MIRRRKEKFRPILPKSQGVALGKSEEPNNSDVAKVTEKADSVQRDSCEVKVTDKVKDAAVLPKETLTDDILKCQESAVTPEENEVQNIQNSTKPPPIENNVPAIGTKTDPPATKTPAAKEPPKSRRRKLTAMPNTKRAAPKPSLNKVKSHIAEPVKQQAASSTNDQLPGGFLPPDSQPVPETAPVVREPGSVQSPVLLPATASSPQKAISNTVALVADSSPPPVSAKESPVNMTPTRPAVSVPPLQKSPSAGSKVLHIHARRPPNVAQATRVRHDSVRESAVREKQNRQRAIDKLKILQLREADLGKGKKQWPTLDHNLISMSDLIYLNPPRSAGKEPGMRAKLREVEEMAEKAETPVSSPAPAEVDSETGDKDEDEPALVPQLRVNEDGSVVIDEESLVINSTPKSVEVVNAAPAIYESGLSSKVNTLSFRKRPPAKASRWTEKQTRKFFTALGVVGADFDLMSAMFRHRTRDELRRKYNLECRRNFAKIDDALRNQHLSKWTDDMFKPQSSSDDETKPPAAKQRKKKATKTKHIDKTSPSDLALPVTVPENIPFDTSQSHNILTSIIQHCEIVVDSSQACAL